jgi:hypothetical protein
MSRVIQGEFVEGRFPDRRYSDVVRVNAADIKNGKKNNPRQCPLALAILRKHPTAGEVAVSNPFVFVHFPKRTNRYVIDQKTWDFVYLFDHNQPVKPATFSMALDFIVDG